MSDTMAIPRTATATRSEKAEYRSVPPLESVIALDKAVLRALLEKAIADISAIRKGGDAGRDYVVISVDLASAFELVGRAVGLSLTAGAAPLAFRSASAKKDWLAEYAAPPDAVRAFCEKHSMLGELEAAVNLVKGTFPSPQGLSIYLSTDPEWEVEKAVVAVTLKCSGEEAFAAYDSFVTQWIVTADWEARKRICLSYNIV